MKRSSGLLAVLAAALVLVVSACGGDSGVPEGAVAVVDGTEISKGELDRLMERTKKGFEAQDQTFPKAGTPEFQQLQQQTLAFLVQREQLEQAADELDIEITEQDVDKAVEDFVKTRFGGDREDFEKALKDQGFTEEDLRETLATTVLSTKVFQSVTKDVEVTNEEIVGYYAQNQSQYSTPASRDVRHILIAEKKANGDVDYPKSKAEADQVRAELEDGADFAALVREHSADEQSKPEGGKLTISKGQTVPAFEETSFALAGPAGEDDAAREGPRLDPDDPAAGAQERGHPGVARRSPGRERRDVRHRLRAAGPARAADRDHFNRVTSSACPWRRRSSTSRS